MDYVIDKIEKLFIIKNIEIEDIELFRFGLSKLLANIIVITIIVVISATLHTILPTLGILVSLLFLRSKTGGYHFDNSTKCFLFSVAMPLVVGWVSVSVAVPKTLLLIACMLASILTMMLAPIDHPNKRLSNSEKNYFKKKTIVSMAILYFVILISEVLLPTYEISKFIEIGILTNFISMIFTLIKNHCQRENR